MIISFTLQVSQVKRGYEEIPHSSKPYTKAPPTGLHKKGTL